MNTQTRSFFLGKIICRFSLICALTLLPHAVFASQADTAEKTIIVEKNGLQTSGKQWTPQVWLQYVQDGPVGSNLPDFSRTGYRMGTMEPPAVISPVYNVTDPRYGAVPDDGIDDTAPIQRAIDTAADEGGGVVFLPVGRYDLKMEADSSPLYIRASNIVLRGERAGDSISTLFLHSPGPDAPVRRLGTVPGDKAARATGAAIAVIGSEERTLLSAYSGDVLRGEKIVQVSGSQKLRAGQMVVIEYTDPAIDTANPAPGKADLVKQLTYPFQLTADQIDTFGKTGRTVSWIVQIERIIDSRTIQLAKPARFNQYLRYSPKIYSFSGVSEIGIETLAIGSSWLGGYRHHKHFKDVKGVVIRTAKEQDYLWNGIWMSNAVDSWVRDVTFTDLTQGAILTYCADTILKNLAFKGKAGHAGITLGRSNGVLVQNSHFYAPLVHPVTLTMLSSGNVVTNATTHYRGRDDYSETDTVLDFHGMFPFENLFDNLNGFYICPGGDMSVLPHAGVRNVFWNITAPREMSCYTKNDETSSTEFMRTYTYIQTSSKSPATMYEHLPQAFYIGIQRQEGLPLTIGGHNEDFQDNWVTIEGINSPGLSLPSLYEGQKGLEH